MGAPRILLDAYYTPDALASRLVSVLPIGPGDRVWEPHAGGGAFMRALLATGAAVTVSDIDPEAPALRSVMSVKFAGDFLAKPPESEPHRPTWIAGNPPFRGIEAHIEHALTWAPNVAFLARAAIMESAGRVDLWRRWPLRKVWILAERPSFTGGGTDSCAYAWFWFQRGYAGSAEVVPGWSWRAAA